MRRIIDLAQVRQLPVAGAAIFDLSQQPSRIGTDAYEKMPELAVIPGSASTRFGLGERRRSFLSANEGARRDRGGDRIAEDPISGCTYPVGHHFEKRNWLTSRSR